MYHILNVICATTNWNVLKSLFTHYALKDHSELNHQKTRNLRINKMSTMVALTDLCSFFQIAILYPDMCLTYGSLVHHQSSTIRSLAFTRTSTIQPLPISVREFCMASQQNQINKIILPRHCRKNQVKLNNYAWKSNIKQTKQNLILLAW